MNVHDATFMIVADGMEENFVHGEQQVYILRPLIEHLIAQGWDDFEKVQKRYTDQTHPWVAKALRDVLAARAQAEPAEEVEPDPEPADSGQVVADSAPVDLPVVSKSSLAREARVNAARSRRPRPRNAG